MTNIKTNIVMLTLVAALPLSVSAQTIPERGPIPFAAYDQNGNGSISEKEFKAVRAERMAQKAASGRAMRNAGNEPSFTVFDVNNDGKLSKKELADGQAMMRSQRGQRNGMGGMRQGGGQGTGKNMPAFVDYDLNGDGVLKEKEFNQARSQRMAEKSKQGLAMRNAGKAPPFAVIDLNNDGKVTQQEFAKHQTQRRAAMQGGKKGAIPVDDREFIEMPKEAQSLMRADMQMNLSALNAIIASLAERDFAAAADIAESEMGRSAMGKHRSTGFAPGMFMSNDMRSLGRGKHEAASQFAEVAKTKNMKKTLMALNDLTNSCVACHSSYRIR